MILEQKTKVLLPPKILEQKEIVTEQEFINMVLGYLERYRNYRFIEVQGHFAICTRPDANVEKRRRNGT